MRYTSLLSSIMQISSPASLPGCLQRQPDRRRPVVSADRGFFLTCFLRVLRVLAVIPDWMVTAGRGACPRGVECTGGDEPGMLSEYDLFLLGEGNHHRSYECMGAHLVADPTPGVRFVVWAPHARGVSVIGDFNGWDGLRHR